jgi:hypothetical protein
MRPNVDPCFPGTNKFAVFSLVMQAPIGTPDANPFARVTTSGLILEYWNANHLPVLPIPH